MMTDQTSRKGQQEGCLDMISPDAIPRHLTIGNLPIAPNEETNERLGYSSRARTQISPPSSQGIRIVHTYVHRYAKVRTTQLYQLPSCLHDSRQQTKSLSEGGLRETLSALMRDQSLQVSLCPIGRTWCCWIRQGSQSCCYVLTPLETVQKWSS